MSWAANEWKDGLPHKALRAIEEMEKNLEWLKKERTQRQYQFDTLEQALGNQKKKVEEERSLQLVLKKEKQSLVETCDDLEKKRQKLIHDVATKDGRIACLEGQLDSTKLALKVETNKNKEQSVDNAQKVAELQESHNLISELKSKMEEHQEYIQRHKQETSQYERQMEALKAQLKDSQHQCATLEMKQLSSDDSLSQKVTELQTSQNLIAELKSKLEELRENNQRHKEETSVYDRQMEALKAELNESQNQCATSKVQFDQLKQQCEAEKNKLSVISKVNADLEEKCDKFNSEVLLLKGQLDKTQNDLQMTREKSENVISELKSNIEQLVREKKDLSETVHLKDVQLADIKNVQHEKDDNAKVLQSQAEQLKQQIDKDQSCYNNLQSEKMEAEQKCHVLEVELSNIQVQLSQVQKELSETTEKSNHLLNELKMNAEQLVMEKDRLSETVKSKDAIIAMLENEKLVMEDKARLLSSQADQLKQMSDAEKVENERLRNERIDLEQKCQALNTELSEVKGQLTEAQSQILTVTDKSNNLINELKMNIEQITSERNELLQTIKVKDSLISKLENDQDEINSKTKILNSQSDQLKQFSESEKHCNERLQSEKDDLEIKCEQLNSELTVLKCQISEYQSDLTTSGEKSNNVIIELKSKIELLISEKDSLYDSIKWKDETISKFENDQSEKEEVVNELVVRACQLEQQLETNKPIIENLRVENHALQEECEKLNIKLTDVTNELCEANKNISTKEVKSVDVTNHALSKIDTLTAEISSLNEDNRSLADRLSAVSEEKQRLSDTAEQLQHNMAALHQKLSNSQQQNKTEEHEEERNGLIQQIEQFQTKQQSLGDSLAQKEAELETSRNLISEMKSKLEKHQEYNQRHNEETSLFDKQMEALRRQLEESQNQYATLKAQFDQLKQQCEAENNELSVMNKVKTELEEKCDKFNSEVLLIKGQLDKTQNDLQMTREKSENVISELKSNIEQLVREKKDLSESVHLKDVQLADIENVQHEKDDNAKVLQSQAEQLKQQIDKDQSCFKNLQSEKMEAEQKCHVLEVELSNFQVQLSQVQKELSETTEKSNHLLNELKMNAEQLVMERDRLSETIKSKDVIIASLESEQLDKEDKTRLLSSQADQLKQMSDAEKVENERLRNERIDLEQKCQDLSTEFSEVKGQLTEAQSQILTVTDKSNNLINELKMNIEQITSERNELLQTIKGKDSLIAKLENDQDEINSKTKILNSQSDQLKQFSESEQHCNERLQSEKDDLEIKCDQLNSELTVLKCQISEYQSDLTTSGEKSNNVIIELKSKIELLISEKDSLYDSIKWKDETISKFENDQSEKEEVVNELVVRACQLEQQLETNKPIIKNLRGENHALQEECEKLNIKLADVTNELCEANKNISTKEVKSADVTNHALSKIDMLTAEISSLTADNQSLADRLSAVSEEKQRLSDTAEQLQHNMAAFQQKLNNSQQLLQQKELKQDEEERNRLVQKIEQLEMKQQSLDDSLTQKVADLESSRNLVSELKAKLEEHHEYKQRHEEETSLFDKQMEALKGQLDDSQNQYATLKIQFDQLKQQCEAENNELSVMNKVKTELEEKCDKFNSEVEVIKGRLEDSQNDLQMTREKSENVISELKSNIEQLVCEKKDLSESVHLKDIQLADLVNVQHEKDANAKFLQSQAEQLKQQIDKDQSCHKNLQSEKMEAEQKCHVLEVELSNVQVQLSKVQKELTETTEKSNHLLNELKMNAEQLVMEKDRLSETIKSKDVIIASLESEQLDKEDKTRLLSSQADQLQQMSDAEKVVNEHLRNERIDLEQKCQALSRDLSEVKGQLTEAQSQILTVTDKSNNLINELKMNIEQITNERNGLLETIKVKDSLISKLENDQDEINSKTKILNSQSDQLKQFSESEKHCNERLQSEKDDLEIKCEQLNSELTVLKCQISEYQSDLTTSGEKSNNVIIELKSKIELLISEKDSLYDSIKWKDETISKFENDQSEKEEVVNELVVRACQLEQQLETNKPIIKNLRGENRALQEEFEKLNIKLTDVTNELCEANKNISTKEVKSADVTNHALSKIDTLTAEISSLTADNQSLADRLSAVSEEKQRLSDTAEQLQHNMVAFQQKLNNSQQLLQQKDLKVHELEDNVNELLQQLLQLRENPDRSEDMTIQRTLAAQINDRDRELNGMKVQIDQLAVSQDDAKTEIRSLTLEVQEKEEQLALAKECANTKTDGLKASREMIKARLEETEHELVETQHQLESSTDLLAEKEAMITQMKSEADRRDVEAGNNEAATAAKEQRQLLIMEEVMQNLRDRESVIVDLEKQLCQVKEDLNVQTNLVREKEDQHKRAFEQLRNKIDEMVRTTESKHDENSSLQGEIQHLQNSLECQRAELQQALDYESARVKELLLQQDTVGSLSEGREAQLIADHQHALTSMTNRVHSLEAQIESRNAEMSKMMDSFNAQSSEATDLVNAKQLEIDELRNVTDEKEQTIQSCHQSLTSLTDNLKQANKKIENLELLMLEKEQSSNAQREKTEEETSALVYNCEEYQSELCKVKAELVESVTKSEHLCDENKSIIQELDELKVNRSNMESVIESVTFEKEQLQVTLDKMQSQHTELEERLASLDVEVNTLKAEKQQMKHQVQASETDLTCTQASSEDTKKEIARLETKIDSHLSRIHELEGEKNDLSDRFTAVMLELEELQGIKEHMISSKAELELKLETLREQVDCYKEENTKLREHESLQTATMNKMTADLETGELEKNSVKIENQTLMGDLERCKHSLHEAETTKEGLYRELEALNLQVESLRNKCKSVEIEAARNHQTVDNLQNTALDLTEEVQTEKAHVDRLKSEKTILENQLSSLKSEKEELDSLYQTQLEHSSDLQAQFIQLQTEAAVISSERTRLQGVLDDLNAKLESSKDDKGREISSLLMANEELKNNCSDLESKTKSSQCEKEDLRQHVASLGNQLDLLKAENEQLNADKQQMTFAAQQIQMDIDDINTQLHTERNHNVDLVQSLCETKERLARTAAEKEQTWEDLYQQVTQLQSTVLDHEQQIMSVTASKNSAMAKIVELEAHISNLTREKETLFEEYHRSISSSENLNSKLQESSSRIVQLQQDKSELSSCIDELVKQLKYKDEELDNFQTDLDKQTALTQDATNSTQEASSTLKILQTEKEDLRKQMIDLQEEMIKALNEKELFVEDLKDQLTKLQSAKCESQEKVRTALSEKSSAESKIADLEKEIVLLTDSIKILQENSDKQSAVMNDLDALKLDERSHVKELQRQLDDLQCQLRTADQTAVMLRNEKETLESEIEQNMQLSRQLESHIQELNQQYDSLKIEHQDKCHLVKDVKHRLHDAESCLVKIKEEHEVESHNLKSEIQERNERLEEICNAKNLLQITLDELTNHKSTLGNEKQELCENYDKQDTLIQQLKEQLQEKSSSMRTVEVERDDLRTRLTQMQNQIISAEEENKSIANDKDSEIVTLEENNRDLKQLLEASNEEKYAADMKVCDLQSQIKNEAVEKEKILSESQKSLELMDKLRSTEEVMKAQLHDLEIERDNLKSKGSEMEKAMDFLKTEKEKLQEALQDQQMSTQEADLCIQDLKTSVCSLKTERDSLISNMEVQKSQMSLLQDELDGKVTDCESKLIEVNEVKGQLEESRRETEEAKIKCDHLQDMLNEKAKQLDANSLKSADLQAQIDSLHSQRAALQDKVSSIQTEFDDLKTNCYQLDTCIQKYESEKKKMKTKLNETEDQIQALQTEVTTHKENQQEQDQTISHLNKDKSMLQKQVDDLNRATNELKEKLDNADLEMSTLTTEKSELQHQCNTKEREIKGLLAQKEALEEEHRVQELYRTEQHKNEIQKIKTEKIQLLDQIENMNKVEGELRKTISDKNSRLTKAISQKCDIAESIRDLKTDKYKLESRVDELEKETSSLLQQVQDKDKQIEYLQKSVHGLNGDLFALKNEIEEVKQKRDEIRDQLKEVEGERLTLDNTIEKMKSEHSSLQGRINKLQGEKLQLLETINDAKGEKLEVQDQLKKLETEMASIDKELDAEKGQKSEMQKQIDALKQEKVQLQEKNEEYEAERAAQGQQVSDLTSNITELEQKLERKNEDVINLKKELSKSESLMMAQGLMRPQAGNTRRVREDPMLSVQGQKRPGVLSPCDKGKLGKRQCLAQSADTATKSEGTATMLRKPAAARGLSSTLRGMSNNTRLTRTRKKELDGIVVTKVPRLNAEPSMEAHDQKASQLALGLKSLAPPKMAAPSEQSKPTEPSSPLISMNNKSETTESRSVTNEIKKPVASYRGIGSSLLKPPMIGQLKPPSKTASVIGSIAEEESSNGNQDIKKETKAKRALPVFTAKAPFSFKAQLPGNDHSTNANALNTITNSPNKRKTDVVAPLSAVRSLSLNKTPEQKTVRRQQQTVNQTSEQSDSTNNEENCKMQ